MVPDLVSVVLPTNRVSPYLPATIRSVRAQRWPHWELVVVDDGSPDPSALDRLAATDQRICVLHRGHTGISPARNAGVAAARGTLVAFLDDDDLWEPDHLAATIGALQRDPVAVGANSGLATIDGDGRVLQDLTSPSATRDTVLAGGARPMIQNLLLRREVLEAVGGFDETLTTAEDTDLILKVAQAGPLAFTPEVTARYRRHPEAMTADVPRTARGGDEVVRRHLAAARRRGDSTAAELLRRNRRQHRGYYALAGLREARRLVGSGAPRRGAALALWALGYAPRDLAWVVRRR